MDKTQMQALADIARAAGVEWMYIKYIEEIIIYNRPFNAESLARQIFDAAMNHRDAKLRKYTNAILNSDRGPTVSQMNQARYFARTNGGLYAYINYIEDLAVTGHPFDLETCIETVFNSVMDDCRVRLSSKIANAARINLGGNDAV